MLTTFGKADKINAATLNNDSPKNQTETKAQQPSNHEEAVKAFFSAKELAKAISTIDLNKEKTDLFIETYLSKLDENGYISPKSMVEAFDKAGLSKKQASQIFESLTASTNTKSNDQNSKLRQQGQGYDFGNYDISFAIGNQGQITSMNMRGDKKRNLNDLTEINESMCRHTNKAVDRMNWELEASTIMDEVLIYNIIQEKVKQGNVVPNADKYQERFQNKMQANGLEFGTDGKLHGIATSRNKPLKTEAQLRNEYIKQQQMEMIAFQSRR